MHSKLCDSSISSPWPQPDRAKVPKKMPKKVDARPNTLDPKSCAAHRRLARAHWTGSGHRQEPQPMVPSPIQRRPWAGRFDLGITRLTRWTIGCRSYFKFSGESQLSQRCCHEPDYAIDPEGERNTTFQKPQGWWCLLDECHVVVLAEMCFSAVQRETPARSVGERVGWEV